MPGALLLWGGPPSGILLLFLSLGICIFVVKFTHFVGNRSSLEHNCSDLAFNKYYRRLDNNSSLHKKGGTYE